MLYLLEAVNNEAQGETAVTGSSWRVNRQAGFDPVVHTHISKQESKKSE